jgi:hypothetical protein
MAHSTLAALITPEHFEHEDLRYLSISRGAWRDALERAIDFAIERGHLAAMEAATEAIELLDYIDGDCDMEFNGDEFDVPQERLCTPRYGIDQARPPLNSRSRENRPAWLL